MKRIISIVLAMVLLSSMGGTAFAQSGSEYFTDIPENAWYAEYIDICYESGLMRGVDDNKFDPDGTVTNAQMMMVCARIHYLLNGGNGDLMEFFHSILDHAIFFTDGRGEKVAVYSDIKDWFEQYDLTSNVPPVLTFSEEARSRLRNEAAPIDLLTLHVLSSDFMERSEIKQYEFAYIHEGENAGSYIATGEDDADWFGEMFQISLVLKLSTSMVEGSMSWETPALLYLAIYDIARVEKDTEALAEAAEAFDEYSGPSALSDPCNRANLAYYLSIYASEANLKPINEVETVPDMDIELIRRLYRAGIMGGVDEYGTFDGHGTLTRAQLAAVVARVVAPSLRLGYSPASFDFDLLAQMPRDENYMISPISLKLALAMAANGADGETKREILDVLGISDLTQFNEEVKAYIESCNNNELVEFNIANSIWYNTDYYQSQGLGLGGEAGSFSDEFARLIKTYYYGVAETITNASGKKTVNDWIAEQTNGKITDVVTDKTVMNSLALLVNAIYFKGDWQNPFKAESTRDAVFTDRSGAETTTAFMNDTGSYSYSETDSLQMLAKPYKDTGVRMYFILPKEEAALSQAMFDEALNNMGTEYVRFSVPKFKTEYLHGNLKEIMQGFGVKTAFKYPDADFWGMFEDIRPDMPVVISDVIQKTFIEVDEKGTEAAAVTVIDMAPTSAIKPDPVEFICDRPFTYIIRDDSTGTILFMGEYAFAE